MTWRLASRFSVITLALLVVVLVVVLQSGRGLSGLLPAGVLGGSQSSLQGTDLGGTPAPDFRLSDQFGAPISLSQFRGKPVVLTFMYTHCKDVCPLTAEKLHAVMESLGGDAPRVTMLAVSLDPKGDTTAAVLDFSKVHRMADYWHFLTGTQDTLSTVWSSYSIFADSANNAQNHGFGLYVIDKQGHERVFMGDDFTPAQLTGDLKVLLGE